VGKCSQTGIQRRFILAIIKALLDRALRICIPRISISPGDVTTFASHPLHPIYQTEGRAHFGRGPRKSTSTTLPDSVCPGHTIANDRTVEAIDEEGASDNSSWFDLDKQ
jgi:hypothetical protein